MPGKLKVFRLEAVCADFKKICQECYCSLLIAVADKVPNNALEENPELFVCHDQAPTQMECE